MGRNVTPSPGTLYREVTCKSILGESGICDFAVNCYTGCQHACTYCYARFMGRFHHPGQPWGSFVDIKTNAVESLKRQLEKRWLIPPGSVFVSSVSDGYQPIEEKYQLTRQCVRLLLEANYQVHVQTKNQLVRRDFDLMAGRDNVSVCLTITTVDGKIARAIEPAASTPKARLDTLRQAAKAGIPIKSFVGPLLPGLTDSSAALKEVFSELAWLPLKEVYVDRLNLRWGVWPALRQTLGQFAPEALGATRDMLFDPAGGRAYNRHLRENIYAAASAAGLKAPLNVVF